MNDNPYSGFSFDDFLQKEDLQVECTAIAIKRVLARQLEDEMKRQNLTKTEMAKQMQTSRAQLDRLLDPEKTGVSIETISLGSIGSRSSVANRTSLNEIIQLIKKEASRRPI